MKPAGNTQRLIICTLPLRAPHVHIASRALPDLVSFRRSDGVGQVMTLSEFKCERCHGFQQGFATRKGLLEHTVLPLLLIRSIHCEECGDRYKTFGIFSKRIIFRNHTVYVARWATIVILSASAVGGIVALALLR
jgi:hypothetical protein